MAFIASLAPVEIDAAALSALAELCAVAITATEVAASGLAAQQIPRTGFQAISLTFPRRLMRRARSI
jgi:hypothetical protein